MTNLHSRTNLGLVFAMVALFVGCAVGQVRETVFPAFANTRVTTAAPKVKVSELTSSDGQAGDNFGFSVAIDGSVLVASAPRFANLGQGAAYVYVNAGGTWTQVAKLTASDGGPGDRFGYSVAIVGNTIAVGNDVDGVYVFVEPVTGWTTMTETAKLVTGVYGGASVAISPNQHIILVGTPGGGCTGGVGVFYLPNGGWVNKTQSDGELDAPFGWVVAIKDGLVAVGSPTCGNSSSGSVYLFHMPFCRCRMLPFQTLVPTDSTGGDGFGRSVSISEGTLLVGAPGRTTAYIFEYDGTGQARQVAELTQLHSSNNCFACSVALLRNLALVGADTATVSHNLQQGTTFAYVKPANGWTDTSTTNAKFTAPDGGANDFFGVSISLSSAEAVIGATDHTVSGNANQGAVYLFGK